MGTRPRKADENARALEKRIGRLRPRLLARLRKTKRERNWFWLDDEEGSVQDVLERMARHARGNRLVDQGDAALWRYAVKTLFFVVMEAKDKARPTPLRLDEAMAFRAAPFAATLDAAVGRKDCLQSLYGEIASLSARYRTLVEWTLAGLKTGAIARLRDESADRTAVAKCRALKSLSGRLERSGWLERCGQWFGLEVKP